MNAPGPAIRHDVMDPARAAALCATLDLGRAAPSRVSAPASGDPLPPFFHHLYFWDAQAPADLGPDGHPRVGQGVIPDMGLPRRMWAGGRLTIHAPLLAGVPATRTTRLDRAERKTGRSGPLAFVTLHHAVHQAGRLCVDERQDLVYRAVPDPAATPPRPPLARDDATCRRPLTFDPTTLFRYSALTFNGHRIHYDVEYARGIEGYGGLVVHGPLLAQHLMILATEMLGPLSRFDFRLTAPLICGEQAWACGNATTLWVEGPDRRQCILAEAKPV